MKVVFHKEVEPEANALLQLIAEVMAADKALQSASSLTSDQWFTWNQLAMDREGELLDVLATILSEEASPLPTNMQSLKNWAENLVISTLDQMNLL